MVWKRVNTEVTLQYCKSIFAESAECFFTVWNIQVNNAHKTCVFQRGIPSEMNPNSFKTHSSFTLSLKAGMSVAFKMRNAPMRNSNGCHQEQNIVLFFILLRYTR